MHSNIMHEVAILEWPDHNLVQGTCNSEMATEGAFDASSKVHECCFSRPDPDFSIHVYASIYI